jgi:putative transposase
MPRKSQFTGEQIIRALKEVEAGSKADDVARQLGVTVATFYRWKAKCGGVEVSDASNGPEFISCAFDAWACQQHVSLQFSRLGKPTENAHVESFNGKLRDECLNTNWFTDIFDAREKIEVWRKDYNEARPHRALGYSTPFEYIAQLAAVA